MDAVLQTGAKRAADKAVGRFIIACGGWIGGGLGGLHAIDCARLQLGARAATDQPELGLLLWLAGQPCCLHVQGSLSMFCAAGTGMQWSPRSRRLLRVTEDLALSMPEPSC